MAVALCGTFAGPERRLRPRPWRSTVRLRNFCLAALHASPARQVLCADRALPFISAGTGVAVLERSQAPCPCVHTIGHHPVGKQASLHALKTPLSLGPLLDAAPVIHVHAFAAMMAFSLGCRAAFAPQGNSALARRLGSRVAAIDRDRGQFVLDSRLPASSAYSARSLFSRSSRWRAAAAVLACAPHLVATPHSMVGTFTARS